MCHGKVFFRFQSRIVETICAGKRFPSLLVLVAKLLKIDKVGLLSESDQVVNLTRAKERNFL